MNSFKQFSLSRVKLDKHKYKSASQPFAAPIIKGAKTMFLF